MTRLQKAKTAVTLITLLSMNLLPALRAMACAPEFPVAVLSNQTHPDLSLKLFASGNLGVVQPSWARSYLCVAYRYLSGLPLDAREQDSIVGLWHGRLSKEPTGDYVDNISDYLKVRARALGVNDKKVPDLYYKLDSYSYQQNIGTGAIILAKQTLADRIKRYGARSAQVQTWVKGQDIVFGMAPSAKQAIPPAPDRSFDPLMRADRSYQIAAATLYAKDFAGAARLFEAIASDKTSPWSKLAAYLVARCKANEALAGTDDAGYQATVSYIESLIRGTTDTSRLVDLQDLLAPVLYIRMSAAEVLARLVKSVTTVHGTRFGGDVGDLDYTIGYTFQGENVDWQSEQDKKSSQENLNEMQKHDLSDWMLTIRRRDDDWYPEDESESRKRLDAQRKEFDRHAVEKWRSTRSLPWLVAAICLNDLRSPDMREVLEAALSVPEQSPAYLTASYFVIDALLAQKADAQAQQRLSRILARKDLPPSARNLFLAQQLALSKTVGEFVRSAVMHPPVVSSSNFYLPNDWLKKEEQRSFYSDHATFDSPVANDLNRNLPLNGWMKLARDATIPSYLRGRIVRSTWLRAHLLNRPEAASAISLDFARAYPRLSEQIRQCTIASSAEQRRFAVACLVLRNFGMTPYVEGGVERHGSNIDGFDYYNANYWVPLPLVEKKPSKPGDDDYEYTYPSVVQPGTNRILQMMQTYYSPGIKRLLPVADRKAADSETQVLLSNSPARFLGEAVFAWSRSHPDDPRIPEMLYRVVKIPKWSPTSAIASRYSHDAYKILHSRYKGSKWAAKATCWY